MHTISRLLAWRYLINTTHKHSVSTMALICFFATLLGTFSLTLVVSVMGGFEEYTHKKLQSIHSPIIMESPGNVLDMQQIAPILLREFGDIIKAYAPSTYEQALASNASKNKYHPITIKGVDPAQEPQVSTIQEIINQPRKLDPLTLLLQHNQILIGKRLAEELGVSCGDTVTLLCPDAEHVATHIDLHQEQVVLGGIFETGIEEFDQTLVYCSLELMQQMFCESGITKIGLVLHKNQSESFVLDTLSDRFNMQAYSWKELYPALISALKLEKYAMFFILLLITLVASMNLISLMCMYILHKKKDIALLHIYGMRKRDIQAIFIMIGVVISSIASASGIILAVVTGYCIDHFKLITLPDSYHVSHLPVTFDIRIITVIFALSIIISFCASYFSSKKLLQQKPIIILSK